MKSILEIDEDGLNGDPLTFKNTDTYCQRASVNSYQENLGQTFPLQSKDKGQSQNAGEFFGTNFLKFLEDNDIIDLYATLFRKWGHPFQKRVKSYYYFKDTVSNLSTEQKIYFFLYFDKWMGESMKNDLEKSKVDPKNRGAFIRKIRKWREKIAKDT